MSLTIPDEVRQAIAAVRNDAGDNNFVVVGYDDNAGDKTLAVFGTGSEGITGVKTYLKNDDVCYVLLRVKSEYETAGKLTQISTKFIFIYFRPESTPLKRKRFIGTVEGEVKKLFSPFIHSWEVDAPDQLTEEKVSDLIDNITMKKNKLTTKQASALFVGGQPVADVNFRKEERPVVAAANKLTVPDEIHDALKQVRADGSKTNFAVVGFDPADPKALALYGTGENGLEGLKTFLKEDDICYCLLRVEFTYEKVGVVRTDGIRFLFIVYRPDSISIKRKMVIGTVEGEIKRLFSPYITDMEAASLEALTEEKVSALIDRVTMRADLSTTKKENTLYFSGQVVQKDVKPSERQMLSGVPKAVQTLKFEDEGAFKDAIAAVRADNNETTWCIAKFIGDKKSLQLSLTGSGTGGIEQFASSFGNDSVAYGLLRTEKIVDGRSNTTKFTLVHYQPEGAVSPSLQGAIGVYHGAVLSAFGQVHNSFSCSTKDEVLNIKI